MVPAALFTIYIAMATAGVLGALASGRSPVETEAWVPLGSAAGALVSAAAGLVFAVATVRLTRFVVATTGWARELAGELAPRAQRLDDRALWATALASGVSEELLFRGWLVPALGVVVPAIAFGLLHRTGGTARARWAWSAWAALTGALLGAIFVATGSLVGCVVAHVVVNATNLRWLRSIAPPAPSPPLGVFATMSRR